MDLIALVEENDVTERNKRYEDESYSRDLYVSTTLHFNAFVMHEGLRMSSDCFQAFVSLLQNNLPLTQQDRLVVENLT